MIVVTGANGLVGSHLIEYLTKNYSNKIICIVRKQSKRTIKLNSKNLEIINGDLIDVPFVHSLIQNANYVFHCAGFVSYSPTKKKELELNNIVATQNVVNACLSSEKNPKLCFVSSIASLGKPLSGGLINEETIWSKSDNNSYYSETKFMAELEVWRGIEEGLRAVIVNPAVILGPADWNYSSTKIFKYVFKNNRLYTNKKTDFVDVRDVVNIMYQLMFSEIENERFIVSKGNFSYKYIFDLIAKNFNSKPPTILASKWMMSLAWKIEYLRSFFTGKDPLITKETMKIAGNNSTYSTEKLQKKLNYNFYSIEETIQWTCDELLKRNS